MEAGEGFRQNGRVVKNLGLPLSLLLIVAACEPAESAGPLRSLANFRVEQLPVELPAPWRDALEKELARSPSVPLLAPGASDIVRRSLFDVGWIDPATVAVETRLPEGMRVTFKPRRPLYRVLQGGAEVGVVSHGGFLLPPGLSEGLRHAYPAVPLDPDTFLPAPGRKPADPVLAEALRVWPEINALEENSGLDVVRIERQAGVSTTANGVPPPLCFVLSDGREIYWGRSEVANDPFGLPLGLKAARLGAVMRKYPDLGPVHRLVLDHPRMRAFDHQGNKLEDPEEPDSSR